MAPTPATLIRAVNAPAADVSFYTRVVEELAALGTAHVSDFSDDFGKITLTTMCVARRCPVLWHRAYDPALRCSACSATETPRNACTCAMLRWPRLILPQCRDVKLMRRVRRCSSTGLQAAASRQCWTPSARYGGKVPALDCHPLSTSSVSSVWHHIKRCGTNWTIWTRMCGCWSLCRVLAAAVSRCAALAWVRNLCAAALSGVVVCVTRGAACTMDGIRRAILHAASRLGRAQPTWSASHQAARLGGGGRPDAHTAGHLWTPRLVRCCKFRGFVASKCSREGVFRDESLPVWRNLEAVLGITFPTASTSSRFVISRPACLGLG